MERPERREFFRIRDHLEIEFRSINHEELLKLERVLKYNPAQWDRETVFKKTRPRTEGEEALFQFLKMVDRKLTTILDILNSGGAGQVRHKRYTEVDISGSGLSFVSDVALEEMGYVEIKLTLPVLPYPAIPALCQVVRVKAHKKESDQRVWEVACKFLTINDWDRDLLINYIFEKEREKIRLEKEHRNG